MLCVSSAFGAGYTCPTNREYTTCNEGYYLAYSYTGTSYDDIKYSTIPRAGNACRPCTDYDTYYNRPKGSFYCAGRTVGPVLNKFTITYDLNGGSGTTPDNESCTRGQTCTLNDGATTSFYRAGYVFKGWGLTLTATSGFTSRIFNTDDIVYAVWEPCGIGKYKPGSGTQAAAACSSCPELTPGFEYFPATTNASLTACRQGITKAEEANEYCDAPSVTTELFDIQCYATPDGTWGDCAIGNAWTAKPGSYVGIWKQTMPAENVIENMCIPCGVGTYSEGGLINSCSQCPELTPGFEYAPLTRLTSINNCSQVNYDISLINNNCTSLSGQESQPKIRMRASAETGDWAEYAVSSTEGAVYAVPGAYVNPDMMTNGEYLDIAGFDASNLCVACSVGTYSEGGDVTSCSVCPALRPADEQDGWKISTGGDGATRVQDCYAYLESYPTNCASGSFKRMYRGDAGAGYYGSEWFELEPLRANPGYRVDFEDGQTTAPACVECSVGTYSPGGDVHSCFACPTPELENADEWDISTYGNGATSLSQCYAFLDVFGKPEGEGCMQGFIRIDMGSDGTYDIENAEAMGFAAEPGYYLTGAGLDARCEICAAGTYSKGLGATECTECSAGTYSSEPGASGCIDCPLPIQYAGVSTIWESIEKPLDGIDKCSLMFFFNPDTVEMLPDNMGKDAQSAIFCKYCDGDYGVSDTCGNSCGVPNQINFHCAPGYYQNMSPDDFGNKYTLLNMEDWFDKCAAPGVDYWADGTSRYQCPTGLTTIGYGAGADEAADCGRVLHFGNDTLYLRSAKKTDHALHVGINGDVFYGNMGTDLSKGSLRIKLGDTTYSVYDDSM